MAKWACVAAIAVVGLSGWFVADRLRIPSRLVADTSAVGERSRPAEVTARGPKAGTGSSPPASGNPSATAGPVPLAEPIPGTADERLTEFEKVLGHLSRSYPDNPDALEVAARYYDWRDRTDAAVRNWEQCLELDPTYGHAYTGLASVAARRGRHGEAVALYRKALEISPKSVRTRTKLGESLLAEGKVDKAVALLRETVTSLPVNANGPAATEAFYQLGLAYQHAERFDESKKQFEKALELEPRYAAVQISLARSCLRLGLKDAAQKHQKRYRELRAEELEKTRRENHQFDDARSTGEVLADYYADVGRIYLTKGRPGAAEKVWERATELAPNDFESRQALAWIYLRQGAPEKTIRRLREMAKLAPARVEYPLEIARLQIEMRRFDQAEATLKSLQEAVPEHPASYATLAKLYLRANRNLTQALKLARRAVALSPEVPNYLILSGAHERLRNFDQAAEAIAKALEKRPRDDRLRQMHETLQEKSDKPNLP